MRPDPADAALFGLRRRLIAAGAFGLVCLAGPLAAQPATVEPVQTSLVRYDEDWSVLADPAARTGRWIEPLKYVPLTPHIWLSTGLELRLRNETYRGAEWGDAPDQTNIWVRALPHADLHLGSLRFFVQPVAAFAGGVRPDPSPVDETGIDLLQGFAEGATKLGIETQVSWRAGRQMLVLGSQRLVGARYGPNLPLAFDGVRASAVRGEMELSLIAARPVQAGPHGFDDSQSETKALWGAYLAADALDLYYLGFQNEQARFATVQGPERRDSFGARVHGAASGWHWNIEGVVQAGRVGDEHIVAWTVANEVGVRLTSVPIPLEAMLRVDVASGDANAHDGTLNTFNALFPRGKYFGELSPVGPANIIHLAPQLSAELTEDITLDVAAMAYWRQSVADGVYDIPGNLLRSADGSRGRLIGLQAETLLTWQATPEWAMSGSVSVFTPGAFIRETGSATTLVMAGLETSFRF